MVSSLGEFWRRYCGLPLRDRHFYELIREGTPCHLYFDLEFSKADNPSACGDDMVEVFVGWVAHCLQVCGPSPILTPCPRVSAHRTRADSVRRERQPTGLCRPRLLHPS